MRFKVFTFAAAIGFAVAAGTSPAQALDPLTGTYGGKLKCKGYTGVAPSKSTVDITIKVIDSKLGIALLVEAGATVIGAPVGALLIEDGAKPDKGKLAGVSCDVALLTPTGIHFQADATVKPESDKGTLKGTITKVIDGKADTIEQCTFSVKRTSTTLPVFEFCEVPPPVL
jgi:hypothetical protein